MEKTGARKQLGLDQKAPVLLVFGGSKGAQTINQAVLQCLEKLLEQTQVVHITGQTDWEMVNSAAENLPRNLRVRYHAHSYLHEDMGAALASADLAICRAGASTLGELPLFGLPAVLIPYPYAWRYQKVNAEYLARHGAAVVLEDARMKAELLQTISSLLNNPVRLRKMQSAMRTLAVKDAAGNIARIVLETAEKRTRD